MSKLLDKQINELLIKLESHIEEQKKVQAQLQELIKQKLEMYADLACQLYRKDVYKGAY